jgi:hypothetical protein
LLWKILQTSEAVSAHPSEGQFLDEVREEMRNDHWNPEMRWDWSPISEVWHSYWNTSKPVLLEKSPPNLLRAPKMEAQFEPAYFLVMMRNPYAFIEGVERRDNGMGFEEAARFWLKCARFQRRNLDELERTLHFTYEELTEKTEDTLEHIADFVPELEGFDLSGFESQSFLGKQDKIHNMNSLKINRLGPAAIAEINPVLEKDLSLLEFYGYELLDPGVRRILKQAGTRAGHFLLRAVRYRGLAPDFVVKPLEKLVFRFTR